MKRLLLPLCLFVVTAANAQRFGGNPPSIKWRQVNTPAAKVIFPQGMDSTAKAVANAIETIRPYISGTIGSKQRQVSIVLQNQTTVSNAYVGLAPFRSEFYLTPSQNSFELGSLYWPNQLAIHEYRHVQQYNNFNVGLSHVLKILFGEGGQALGNDLSVPNWFFEGDAVYNETLVSQQGRGRLPNFYNGYRAIWAARKNYSWMKLRNGSYVDFIPDHYPLGYMMVAYGRDKYGDDFWPKVTQNAAAYRTGFYPFQKAIKKYSGERYSSFRRNALDHFKQEFSADPKRPELGKLHFVANEEYPAYVNDSTLIFLRTSYNRIPQIVMRKGSRDSVIAVQSITNDGYFNYRNGKIVYAAYRPDKRWGYRNYSELVVLDIASGKERRITSKTKYYASAFSNDGSRVVAVDVDPSGKSALHILDAATGARLAVVPNPEALFYTYPKFYKEQIVSAVRSRNGKMALVMINPITGSFKELTPFSFATIGFPTVYQDAVFYTESSGKDDRLYVTSITNGVTREVNHTKNKLIGAYQPAIGGGKVAWVGFTTSGYQIQEQPIAELLQPTLKAPLSDLGIKQLGSDSAAKLLAAVRSTEYPVTKYSKAHGLFNFHSLIPNLNDPNYSISLAGQNILNTFQSRLSGTYNRDEGYKWIGYTAIYGALFPYISAGANYTVDRRGFRNGESIYFNETDLHAGLQVPLNFTAGKTSKSLSFGSDVYYSQRHFQEAFRSRFNDSHYTYLNNYISFNNQIQQARQQINPRFAQSVSLNYKTAIAGMHANQFLANAAVYLPGISLTHSLVLSGAYQRKGDKNGIGFSNDFPFSKGYSAESLKNMSKAGVSYHFPIAYPDAGFANLAYLLRIRGYLYYDHTHASDNSFTYQGQPFKANFRSAGAAVFFDGKLFNQGDISFGVRYSRLLDPDLFGNSGRNRIELVLPVSLF